jgi:opacity protein-like surface antigen
MKKIILLFAVCSLSSVHLFAQKFHFGLGITPTASWIHASSDDLEGDGSKIGFNYGLITEFAFTENYSLATGITFDNNGGKLRTKDAQVDTLNFQYEFKLQYVELPITLKMKTNPVGYIRYYGQFGVAPEFLIGAKGTYMQGSTLVVDDDDIKDDINNLNVSLIIGLGLEYNLSGNTNLLLGIQYKNGFSDVLNSDSKATVSTLGLNIGILF